jgi:hypothetical protein
MLVLCRGDAEAAGDHTLTLMQAMPFLRHRTTSEELLALVESVMNNRSQVISFVKTEAVPALAANAFFFVVALLFILIFVLWCVLHVFNSLSVRSPANRAMPVFLLSDCRRPLRWCCFVCCCRSSCDARRAKGDPMRSLFGAGTVTLKARR